MFAQAGLSSIPAESAGAMRVEANVNGSLFSGMRTNIKITGEDMITHLDGVTTTDILSTGFTGQLQVESGDIEPWLLSLGYGLPGMGLGTTTDISASASWRSGKAVLRQIDAVLNGNRVTGDLTVDATGEVPTVRGDLAFEYLDAGELYSVISGDPSAAIFDIDTGGLLQQEFGPPILAGNDVEVGVKAGEVSLPAGNESLRDLTGTLVYRDGGMALRGIEATFGGGTISGLAGAQNNDGLMILNVQIAAKGVSVDALVPPVAPVIAGATDLALQLTGSGRSNAALLSSLSGSGVLSTGPLTVTGLNAEGFAPMIARADAIGYEIKAEQMKALADDAFLAGTSVLPAADYPVSVANGTVRIANATARTGAMSLSADAGVNLLTGAISGKARVDFDPGEEAIAGPQPELALAFASNAEGGFDVTRNYEAVTGYLTQRALEKEQARVEALQARLLERQRLRREVQLFKYRKRMRLQSMEGGAAALARGRAHGGARGGGGRGGTASFRRWRRTPRERRGHRRNRNGRPGSDDPGDHRHGTAERRLEPGHHPARSAAGSVSGAWAAGKRLVQHEDTQGRREVGVARLGLVDLGDQRGQRPAGPRGALPEQRQEFVLDGKGGAVAGNRDRVLADGHQAVLALLVLPEGIERDDIGAAVRRLVPVFVLFLFRLGLLARRGGDLGRLGVRDLVRAGGGFGHGTQRVGILDVEFELEID